MMCQCFFGVMLSLLLIMIKDANKISLKNLEQLGIIVPDSPTLYRNCGIGFKAGVVGLVPVLFGNFALNYTCIPLYLAFRRCGLLSSVVVMFL